MERNGDGELVRIDDEDELCDFCDKPRKHLVKRDAGYDEHTCQECYKEQYPEEEDEEEEESEEESEEEKKYIAKLYAGATEKEKEYMDTLSKEEKMSLEEE